ncbi:SagB/ThcOx family dehydrogenase [Parabacteroides sp. OttesenSCG-928-O15]|nr:SagB/ThcOx family dehydrogenase [Parabacteroides sp. OttesenSCG-928-O15]
MKKIYLMASAILLAATVSAQSLKPIKLVTPSKDRGTSIMQSLANRQSVREFSEKKLSEQDLSDVIWAACGINRPAEGKRTSPTAMNKQDVDLYVFLAEGVYLYDAKNHSLTPVAAGDHRPLISDRQPTINKAPAILLMVSDLARFDVNVGDDVKREFGALDVGIVSQNISLFCAGCGLVTVPRAFMDKEKLKTLLKLSDTQVLMLNNPVGYPK